MARMLRAGGWTLDLDERGVVRHIRLGSREVLRGLAGVVRDADWGTVEGEVSVERCDIGDDDFCVVFTSAHCGSGVDLVWTGTVEGRSDSTLRMSFDARVRQSSRTNRIGLVALHALDGAGTAVEVVHTDGTVEDSRFPALVAPHQPFVDVAAFRQRTDAGSEIEIRFEGDVFETEDQRNWSDASFKTYSRPLSLPFPYTLEAGETVSQTVTLRATGNLPVDEESSAPVTVRITDAPASWPRLGVGWAAGYPDAGDALRELQPAWIRVDVSVGEDGATSGAEGLRAAAVTGLPIELAVTAACEAPREALARVFAVGRVDHVLAYTEGEPTTGAATLDALRAAAPVGTPVRGGTDGNLAELNRFPPAPDDGGAALSINAQVHDTADLAVMQTTEAYASMIDTVRQRCATDRVTVSPITLRPRRNLYATAEPLPATAGMDPATVDPRQHEPFTAAWTIAALAALSAARVDEATLFEHAGPRGVLHADGTRTPVADVLSLAFAADGAVVLISAEPKVIAGVALRVDGAIAILLANLTDRPRQVVVEGTIPRTTKTIAPFDVLLLNDRKS